jgi:hypothetical protein
MRAWLVLALVACGGSKSAPSGPGARAAAIDAWKQAGLDVSAFAPATASAGKDCAAGTVAKLDVLVCNYGSVDDAIHAADLGLQWVGDTTGSSQARGTLVIAVADRHKADPHGKTMNQIFNLASN